MDIIEAEFEVIAQPAAPRIPWRSIFWFGVYATGFATVVAGTDDTTARAALTFCAALAWPAVRLVASVSEAVPAQQARQLRQRLLSRDR